MAYLQLRAEIEADAQRAPSLGQGKAAWTPMHRSRAKAAEAGLTERIRAARRARTAEGRGRG